MNPLRLPFVESIGMGAAHSHVGFKIIHAAFAAQPSHASGEEEKMTIYARSIALMVNDPQRFHVALHALRKQITLADSTDALGVGTCVDGSVLLSRKPTIAPGQSLAELVGPLKGRCAVVQLRDATDLRPRQMSTSNIGPYRSRHLACAVVGGPQTSDEASDLREQWMADMPDFALRSVTGQAESEAFFFACVAELHKMGQLERMPRGAALVDAISQVMERDKSNAPRAVSLATGLECAFVTEGVAGTLAFVEGLSNDDADDVDPTLTDSSMGRERLRRFRATLAISGGDQEKVVAPAGCRFEAVAPSSATIIGRDGEATRVR